MVRTIPFKLVSLHKPTPDQAEATEFLVDGVLRGVMHQTLHGITGSGKTRTMAEVIQELQCTTAVLTHNKTLGAQLYGEFTGFFPTAPVYFLHSPYGFYRPESYNPRRDEYKKKIRGASDEEQEEWDNALSAFQDNRRVIIVATTSALFPKGHRLAHATRPSLHQAVRGIETELDERIDQFKQAGKALEAAQLQTRVGNDLQSLIQTGSCYCIENYSRHLDGREAGERPVCLFDLLPAERIVFIDESHVTLPQVRAMEPGFKKRMTNLVQNGFALPSALDGGPISFSAFEELACPVIYVSATPGEYELEKSDGRIAEQIIRPTGLLDPVVEVHPIGGQTEHLIGEIKSRAARDEGTLVSCTTIRMAEYICDYLNGEGIPTGWMSADLAVAERQQLLIELYEKRLYVIVGANLLREGLDLPWVSFVAVLDADDEGFLRDERSLIQLIGRAARNVNGKAVLYGKTRTFSMRRAVEESDRRRGAQQQYNEENGIVPRSIIKPIDEA